MKSFSDEDLKKARRTYRKDEWVTALIRRLDAAEAMLNDTVVCPCENSAHFHLLKYKHIKAWWKASGWVPESKIK